jgi:hypothetical protein
LFKFDDIFPNIPIGVDYAFIDHLKCGGFSFDIPPRYAVEKLVVGGFWRFFY